MQCFDDEVPVHGLFIADSILSKKDTLVAIAGTIFLNILLILKDFVKIACFVTLLCTNRVFLLL
jgi:hypothetical protein